MLNLVETWNEFFFARIGCIDGDSTYTKKNHRNTMSAFHLIGYLRIAYGVCILLDRIVLSFDFNMFFLHNADHQGNLLLPMIPCQQYMKNLQSTLTHNIYDATLPNSPLCTLAAFLPIRYHFYLYWTFHIISILNAVLLILGVYPKVQLLFLHLNMLSLHYHNLLLWDAEDVMFKIWNILFLFLPLHYRTIYDLFPKNNHRRTKEGGTYPIWPIRLYQIELCCIYAGAGYSKLSSTVWRNGNALYYIIHLKDFFGGPFVPEFIFHHYGPLKLLTWSSLFLECTCIFLVWSSNRFIKYITVLSMITLHLGIDLTMNMHMFEWLSIIGWCMIFVEPSISYKDYCLSSKIESSATASKDQHDYFYHRQWFVNAFLCIIIVIFIVDTFPLIQLYHLSNYLILTLFSKSTTLAKIVLETIRVSLLSMYHLRNQYFKPFMHQFIEPFGLYQGVWDLFSSAQDTSCRYKTTLTMYSNVNSDRIPYSYISPDWSNMTWYQKKRYQRLMTMYENSLDYICRDCYTKYRAHNEINNILASKSDRNNLQLAAAVLSIQCEQTVEPPAVDDWLNWTGWFYANAKEATGVQREPYTLYSMNFCNDTNVELCQRWYNAGLCDIANKNHMYRHSLEDSTILTDRDEFVFNITQTCRQSCSFCPEHGYNTNNLNNGTLISIFWPIPTWDKDLNSYHYDNNAMYYDGTIIQVHESPLKQYLLRYDNSTYDDEWFDPITLLERGYRFVVDTSMMENINNVEDKNDKEVGDTTHFANDRDEL